MNVRYLEVQRTRGVPGHPWPFPKDVRVVLLDGGHIKYEWYEDLDD